MDYKEFVREAQKRGFKKLRRTVFDDYSMGRRVVFEFSSDFNGKSVQHFFTYQDIKEMGYEKALQVMARYNGIMNGVVQ